MGEVWSAVDGVLGRTVAVKIILPALLADTDFAQRFQAEAKVMAMIGHPGIVDVYDYGESRPRAAARSRTSWWSWSPAGRWRTCSTGPAGAGTRAGWG